MSLRTQNLRSSSMDRQVRDPTLRKNCKPEFTYTLNLNSTTFRSRITFGSTAPPDPRAALNAIAQSIRTAAGTGDIQSVCVSWKSWRGSRNAFSFLALTYFARGQGSIRYQELIEHAPRKRPAQQLHHLLMMSSHICVIPTPGLRPPCH